MAVWTSAGLLGRVVEAELAARLPGWQTVLWDQPTAVAATLNVLCLPLGTDIPSLRDDDPVVLTGVRISGEVSPELAALAGRASAITVRDAESRARLRDAGIEAGIVPHPGLLLDRVVDRSTLPSRAEQLRQLGMLAENPQRVVAPAELPADLCLEDLLAVLAASTEVVATDEHVAAAAAGLGVPWVLVDPDGEHRAAVEEFADPSRIVGALEDVDDALRATRNLPPHKETAPAAVAAALDRVAELAEQAVHGDERERRNSALTAENLALRAANHRQRDRDRATRLRLADAFASAVLERDTAVEELAGLRGEHAELAARHAELAGRLAACERELNAWQHTRLVRWSRPLRAVYGRVRGR